LRAFILALEAMSGLILQLDECWRHCTTFLQGLLGAAREVDMQAVKHTHTFV